ncbi:glycosyltransferase family 87 protein [Paracoccus sp. PAR01]|uniref:glycosyltransferase family 87 protein n=1 Tax=Paracoccus sp. PAR01 TaxID=2769282 RepID=UPI00177D9DAB|nr:glycosyltransferase family 87 protein [Paracoccus sp. PAR01]MBD9527424.1 DUF2029 domain-containing protein [Paracoccus sp. PAR01]
MSWVSGAEKATFPKYALALLLLGAVFFVIFGIVGIGRSGEFAFDMPYLYVAGDIWEKGASPYSADLFKEAMRGIMGTADGNYAYPPNSSYLSMAFSAGSVAQAKLMSGIFNTLALICMIGFVWLGSEQSDDSDEFRLGNVLIAGAVILGNPFAAHVAWMGQTTLISGAFLLFSWYFAERKRDVLAGLFLALGAFKPQLAILVGFWFLLDRRWVLLASAAGGTVLLSAWPMLTSGLQGSWFSWLKGLREYQDTVYNVAGFKHLFGIRSGLANFGVETPTLAPLAVLGVVVLYLQRRAYENCWLIGAIFCLTFLFVYAHDYDIAPATILAYPLVRAARGNAALLGTLAVLACILFFPQRIWEAVDLPQFARSREVALLLLLTLYLTLCRAPVWKRGLSRSA